MALAFVRPPLPPPSTHHHYSFLGARFRRSNTILISLLSSCLLVLVFPITSIRADDHPGEGNLTAVLLEGMCFLVYYYVFKFKIYVAYIVILCSRIIFFLKHIKTLLHIFYWNRKCYLN